MLLSATLGCFSIPGMLNKLCLQSTSYAITPRQALALIMNIYMKSVSYNTFFYSICGPATYVKQCHKVLKKGGGGGGGGGGQLLLLPPPLDPPMVNGSSVIIEQCGHYSLCRSTGVCVCVCNQNLIIDV